MTEEDIIARLIGAWRVDAFVHPQRVVLHFNGNFTIVEESTLSIFPWIGVRFDLRLDQAWIIEMINDAGGMLSYRIVSITFENLVVVRLDNNVVFSMTKI